MFNEMKFKDVKSATEEELSLEEFRIGMIQLMGDESTQHYRMGLLHNRAVDKKLAEGAGYKNLQDYLRQKLPNLSYTSLRQYGAVAANFREPISVQYGVTCLFLLLTYKEAADMEINHEEPGGTLIEVPGDNGAVTTKPFSACTVDEMRKAIQRKRKPASSKPLPADDLALAGQYQEAVNGKFPMGVTVKVLVRNQKGKAVLDIQGIPVKQMDTLLKALSSVIPGMLPEQRAEMTAPTAKA